KAHDEMESLNKAFLEGSIQTDKFVKLQRIQTLRAMDAIIKGMGGNAKVMFDCLKERFRAVDSFAKKGAVIQEFGSEGNAALDKIIGKLSKAVAMRDAIRKRNNTDPEAQSGG
ncbi:MAG: hypothetical protein ACREH5_07830, partial [Candidatus Omnitrophota bacterium]